MTPSKSVRSVGFGALDLNKNSTVARIPYTKMAQSKRKLKPAEAPTSNDETPPSQTPSGPAATAKTTGSKRKCPTGAHEEDSAPTPSTQPKAAAQPVAQEPARAHASPEPAEQEEPAAMQQGHDREDTLDDLQLRSETLDDMNSLEADEAGKDVVKGKTRQRKLLSEGKLKRLKEEYDRRGVVYVSRIPPHMKPMKLKQLLSAYGETLRVYCTPEDASARKLRKKKGGNTGKNFTEGWVEFADKRVAKRVALALNGQRIGGKRRSAYYDDLWCIKYLKHFKWDHLTEEINYQKAVREQRLAFEISAAKRERDHYLSKVDQSKALTAMAERRASKAPQAQGEGTQGGDKEAGEVQFRNRDLVQRPPQADPAQGKTTGRELSDDVLMMVARKKRKTEAAAP